MYINLIIDIRQLERINKDPDIFTNKKLLNTIITMPNNNEIFVKFKENFNIIRDFLDRIIEKLLNNVSIIPYPVRCLCKIIDMLIAKKVKNY